MRRDFVDKAGFEALLSERGISNDDTVILYGGNNNWFAAYAYWYFKLYGHQNVKLLDGGRKKWELDSRELVKDLPDRPRRATPPGSRTRRSGLRDEVVAAIGKRNLVDVRSPDEFSGRLLAPAHLPQEQAQRGGHIPTAKNVPWSKAANDNGTFRSDDELRTLYGDEAGLDFAKDTIAYCRIGERSAHTWFVLHELLDQPNVRTTTAPGPSTARWWACRSSWVMAGERGRGECSGECGRVRGTRGWRGAPGRRGQPGRGTGAGDPRWRGGAGRLRPAAQ